MANITLKQLRYAVAVAEHGHFGHAAAASAISQPALSMQIQALEDGLGLALFERAARHVRPTPFGVGFLARAQRILAEVDDLGDSARAALMTRGYAEMARLAGALGAAPETLAGLSGFGDLVLTCTSAQSRNYRFGMALGRGDAFDPAVTVEGAATARAAVARAAALGVELPITTAVVGMIDGQLSLRQAMESLLSRPLKKE